MVGWKKHARTQELGGYVTSLPDKALGFSHMAVKFSFTVLKQPGFPTSRTFTLIINEIKGGKKEFTFAKVDNICLNSSHLKIFRINNLRNVF